ncbi:MAG: hypothetical protein Q9M20_07295 [Mariprofundaceae bacterium]|nr:hypothetical protein [Mariprofundaceae bacterium]
MMSNKAQQQVDDDLWMKHMSRYAIAMAVGIALLMYIFPQLHDGASKMMLASALLGGGLIFGGGFGVAVSLFFHLWHKET